MGVSAGVGLTLIGMKRQEDAAESAANRQVRQSQLNTQFLQEQGQLGADIIAQRRGEAEAIARGIPQEAIESISPFATGGTAAFQEAQRRILTGATDGGISRAVTGAAQVVTGDPIVDAALAREAGFAGQRVAPQVSQMLSQRGAQGLAAASDIAGIQTRGAERLGDIGRTAATQQASALLGLAPQVAQQIQAGQEARALGAAATTQTRVTAAEQLARLAGRVS